MQSPITIIIRQKGHQRSKITIQYHNKITTELYYFIIVNGDILKRQNGRNGM